MPPAPAPTTIWPRRLTSRPARARPAAPSALAKSINVICRLEYLSSVIMQSSRPFSDATHTKMSAPVPRAGQARLISILVTNGRPFS